ncbi:MAG: LAGLIDADG family homing endonuclease, partial [Candidatus Odinarchaeia archaeon]
YCDKRNSVYFYEVTSKTVYQRIKNALGGFKAKFQRSVPCWIMNGCESIRLSFIRGFFDADGFYYVKPEKSDFRIRFGQSEFGILKNVKEILDNYFKCSSVLGPYRSKENVKPYYELHIYGREQVYAFHKLIKPCHPNKQLDPTHKLFCKEE